VSRDHRHRDAFVNLADFSQRLEAVHPRHLDVEDDHVGEVALDDGDALGAGGAPMNS
jgi:hypothetical protein